MSDPTDTSVPVPQDADQKKGASAAFLIILFFLTAILFTVAGAALYHFFGNQLLGNKSCTYNNQTYKDGASFASIDGCNTCTCDNGNVACTEMACLEEGTNSIDTTQTGVYGYIQRAYEQDEKNYIAFMTIDFVTPESEKYDDYCGEEPVIKCPNDYYIDTTDSKVLNLEVTDESSIQVLVTDATDCTLSSDSSSDSGFKSYDIEYDDLIGSVCAFVGENSMLFTLSSENGAATELTEVYLP